MKATFVYILLFSFFSFLSASGQLYPVQVTTQLVPPYSVYLADYASPGNDKLRLVMLQRDITKPSYQIRLQLSVELNGKVIMVTSRAYNPSPINLDPGIPSIISGIDLQPYLDSRNLDFVGYNRQEYERTKALPEGSYQICFTAYDYKRQDVQVSTPACSFYWLAKDEPPLINFPVCGTAIPMQNPQQIIFSWLPRNTSSPTSANDTEYEFSLYETRPAGRNPNDVVLSSQPMYRTLTSATQILYGPGEPILLTNINYVWRVKAIDKNGKDLFRNNGFSEVCTFSYGGAVSDVHLEEITDLQVEGETERRAKAWWSAQENVNQYKVHYKKVGADYRWFSKGSEEPKLNLFDLEPDTKYEMRVQSVYGAVLGPYSDIKQFKTLPQRTYQCGDSVARPPDLSNPLAFATTGMIIDVQGIQLTIKEVSSPQGPGLYKGKGEVTIPFFGGATFNVTFDQLFINEARTAAQGRIDFITKGVEAMIEEQLAEQKKKELEELQNQNREQWKDTDFHEDVFYYKDIAIDSMYVNAAGEVMIVGGDGKMYVNKDIPGILTDAPEKAIILEDKNGDQWVVQSGGRVTKVPGGGLSPTYNIEVSQEALDVVKNALISLRNDYNSEAIQVIADELEQRRTTLDSHIKTHNDQITSGGVVSSTQDGEDFEPLFFDFEIVSDAPQEGNDQFAELSIAAKQKELEHNRGQLLQTLGSQTNIAVTPDLVAREIKIDDKTVSDYITGAKQNGKTDEEILTKAKEGIVTLIDKLLLKASSETTQD